MEPEDSITPLFCWFPKNQTMNFTEVEGDRPLPKFLGWVDFVIFILMLAVSTVVGIYFGSCGKKEDTKREYLLAGKSMKSLPVAFSIVTSIISGITMLGVPTEVYRFGTMYLLVIIPVCVTGIINYYIYLPVFYELQLTSTYEYLELRFNHKVRVMASILYTLVWLLYMPIVIYVPALVLSQVSGVNLHYITVFTSILCIFYTMMGGLKAVVWTDFIQGMLMLIATIIIIILGVIHVGGFRRIWEINEEGGRIRFFEMNPSPFLRSSFWTIVIGLSFNWSFDFSVNQCIVQKFLSLPTFSQARRSTFYAILGYIIIETITIFTGMLIYSTYHDCDLLKSKVISRPDQLTAYYVTDMASTIPGLSGLFVAGIFSASLSTMSSGLNSLGATLFEDFVRPCIKEAVSEVTINRIIKCVVICIGVLCVLLVVVVDKLNGILELTLSVNGITQGALLGLFTFGIFYPRGNSKGALAGSICSLLFMGWIGYGAQTAIADGSYKLPLLPTSVDGCDYNITMDDSAIEEEVEEEVFILYRVSFMYYSLIGVVIMMIVGAIVSQFTEQPNLKDMNPVLFTPIVRKYVIRRINAEKKDCTELELLNTT